MRLIAVAALLIVLAGCAPPTASPSTTSGSGGTSGSGSQQMAEWDRVLAEARREGKVNVIGLQGENTRESLTAAFEREYGITVEFHADSGPGVAPKVATERDAGQYLWDVYVLGTTTARMASIGEGARSSSSIPSIA
jgi:ABC-type glycerol-3-phosphate transport system substrate-binding protein